MWWWVPGGHAFSFPDDVPLDGSAIFCVSSQSLTDTWVVGCFCSWALGNCPAPNIRVRVFTWQSVCISLGEILRSDITAAPRYVPPAAYKGSSFSPSSLMLCCLSFRFLILVLVAVKWYPVMVLICIFLTHHAGRLPRALWLFAYLLWRNSWVDLCWVDFRFNPLPVV